jgi:hypothetical protein
MLKLTRLIRYDRDAKRRMKELEITGQEVAVVMKEPESQVQSTKGERMRTSF